MKKLFVLAWLIAAMAVSPLCAFAENETAVVEEVAVEATEAEISEETEAVDGEVEEDSEVAAESDEVALEADAEESIDDADEATDIVAEDEQQAAASSKVVVDITMIPRVLVVDSAAVIELYDEDGTLLGTKEEWVGGITEQLKLEFDVPEYSAGKKFVLKLRSGLTYVNYYDKAYAADEEIVLETYGYLTEDGAAAVADTFALSGCPLYEQAIIIYADGKQLELYPRARLLDDVAMVPVKPVAEALGIEVSFDEVYNSVVCEVGGEQVIFNMDTAYTTIFGEDTYLPRKSEMLDDTAFVPVRALAEAFGSTVETFDFGDHIDVCLSAAQKVTEYRQSIPVNRWGISSRTGYLVWIDKSDFRVRVYTGSQYNWKEIKSFPCAIGAPGMETPTGSYEYEYRMNAWYYDGYYVGPCLVFWGNYAMHSTLLRYDGTPYDNRTGVKISHGCVRLEKQDIDWLSAYLPTRSRVYITE